MAQDTRRHGVDTFAEGEFAPHARGQDSGVGSVGDGAEAPQRYPEDTHVGTFADGKPES